MGNLEPGEAVGPYRVIGAYPGGGHRALHATLLHRVHLDVHAPGDDWRERAVQLLRATSLVAALEHPGIARLEGRGVLPGRRPWLATELADGVVLSDLLARRTLAVDETLALVRDLASILAHVHRRALVHGAIHPHAIVMRTGERPFPIQLGAWSELRAAGIDAGGGLAPYAAPERTAGTAADIYSVGVLAHRALTGRLPGSHVPELVAGVPGPVSALIVRLLARDPAARPDALAVHAACAELTGDRVLAGPRFARPRWTPVEGIACADDDQRVASVHDLAAARKSSPRIKS